MRVTEYLASAKTCPPCHVIPFNEHQAVHYRDVPMRIQFSLFEGDLINRLFASIGVGGRRARDLAARCLILVGLTWMPLPCSRF